MPIIYRTNNLVNDKIYIGYHNNSDPSYLGSGDAIRLAVKKHGKHNFIRDTIFEGTEKECLELEEFIVDEEFVLSESNYNLTVGGGMPPITYGNNHNLGRIGTPEESKKKKAAFASSKTHAAHLSDPILTAARIAKTKETFKKIGYVCQSTKGKKCYNDGVKNYFYAEGTQPEELTRGMIR